jgi:hypothetical protein
MRRLLTGPLLGIFALVTLFTLSLQPAHAGDPRDFTLVNSTGERIDEVYVGPSSSPDWGSDILGNSVLAAGQQLNVTFSAFTTGDCQYDIKVRTASGREGVLYKVDLCNTQTVTFN